MENINPCRLAAMIERVYLKILPERCWNIEHKEQGKLLGQITSIIFSIKFEVFNLFVRSNFKWKDISYESERGQQVARYP